MQVTRSLPHHQDKTRQMPALLILGFKRRKISLVRKIYRSEVIALSFVFVKHLLGERALGTCECYSYCMNTRHFLIVDLIRSDGNCGLFIRTTVVSDLSLSKKCRYEDSGQVNINGEHGEDPPHSMVQSAKFPSYFFLL